jgi:hypothetical protein
MYDEYLGMVRCATGYREAVKRLSDVLRDDTFDDCSHEITAINEAQDSASRLQAACNLMRCGIGRAFPTEQEVSARPNGEG